MDRNHRRAVSGWRGSHSLNDRRPVSGGNVGRWLSKDAVLQKDSRTREKDLVVTSRDGKGGTQWSK